MKIIWEIGNLEIPNVGLSEKDKLTEIDDKLAKEFIDRGIARIFKESMEEIDTIPKKNKKEKTIKEGEE